MGAYWVFTYAMPRLLAGVWRSRWLDGLAAFTYFVEGICYHVEQKKYKSTNEKATFVAYASYFLAVFVTVRCVYQWNPMKMDGRSLAPCTLVGCALYRPQSLQLCGQWELWELSKATAQPKLGLPRT